MEIHDHYDDENRFTLYHGDCKLFIKDIPNEAVDLIVTSPPYCMKKAYEDPKDDIDTFREEHKAIFPELYRILKPGGSICWQVGYHVTKGTVFPLDFVVYDIFTNRNSTLEHPLILRNRIIWTFGHGLNSTQRFSGRHETILWFTKGNNYSFDLDEVRVPQKYPGKKYYKGPKKGTYSGNPLGKNPSDVWDIPNVKAKHVEKTAHPCQFPISLPIRLIKALVPENGLVFDPYMGSGTSAIAAFLNDRRFIGSEINKDYFKISKDRLQNAFVGNISYRKDIPVMKPNKKSSVATLPQEFEDLRRDSFDK